MESTLGGTGFNAIPEKKIRLGLVPARIGTNIVVKLGVQLALDAPEYPTGTASIKLSRSKSKLKKADTRYERDPVTNFPTKANPGTRAQFEVQELSALPVEQQEQVEWRCTHPGCSGQAWSTKADLVADHGDNRELIKRSENEDVRGGQPHLYYAILETKEQQEVLEVKDANGKVTTKAKPYIPGSVYVLSEEH